MDGEFVRELNQLMEKHSIVPVQFEFNLIRGTLKLIIQKIKKKEGKGETSA